MPFHRNTNKNRRESNIKWFNRHKHNWQEWPDRPGWQFCPNCPAMRKVLMPTKFSGPAIACIAAGSILIWSGLKGTSVIKVVGDLITGKQPESSETYKLTSDTSSSATGSMPSGITTYEGKQVAAWIVPILQCAKSNGWSGSVTSGYRSAADQRRVCATGVRPCAAPGTSHHQGTTYPDGAVDVSNAAQLSAILTSGKCNANGLVWAGSKDPVHFSVPSGGGY